MFKFDFNLEDGPVSSANELQDGVHHAEEVVETSKAHPLVLSTLEDLIEGLPPLISYSPLRIHLFGDKYITLQRRDLFDARFQLISDPSPTAETSRDLEFIDAPSDLVPDVYEGGLKTWECSSDLAAYLDDAGTALVNHSFKIMEIGCGTAIPSLSLLRKVFSADSVTESDDTEPKFILHLQDYNHTVFQLVTLPNIILTWYFSGASAPYRASQSSTSPVTDVPEPGELPLTPELLSAFRQSVYERRIAVTFFGGSWVDLEERIRDTPITYDLILTSETIYRSASVPSLVQLLRTLHGAGRNGVADGLSLNGAIHNPVCLVAAKVIYFGVGGGVEEFERAVVDAGGHTETVLEKKTGVGRRIMKVDWRRLGALP